MLGCLAIVTGLKIQPYAAAHILRLASSTATTGKPLDNVTKATSGKPGMVKQDLNKVQLESKAAAKESDPEDEDDNVNPVTGEWLGPKGPEPTRYGDWQQKGRCTDF